MSMYNLVQGMTPAVGLILPMLGRHPYSYPRFRDCFLKDEEHPEYDNCIHVYTRVGGLNRDDYTDEIAEMRSMPEYLADFDDSFDNTYATYVFSVPDKWREDFDHIVSGNGSKVSQEYQDVVYKMLETKEDDDKESTD